MLNRRLVRIKAMQALFSQVGQPVMDIKPIRSLFTHLSSRIKTGYLMQFKALAELRQRAIRELENEQIKFDPNKERMQKLQRFIQHPLLETIAESPILEAQCQKYQVHWDHTFDILHTLLEEVFAQSFFEELLQHAESGISNEQYQKDILVLVKFLIGQSSTYQGLMEEQFMGWQEDIPVISAQLTKTFGTATAGKELPLLSMDLIDIRKFDWESEVKNLLEKSAADWTEMMDLGIRLCEQTLMHWESHDQLIQSKVKNWDMDRIAHTDQVLLHMALTEFESFESIPPKVTMNEYLELAKVYSSPNSSQFINGILDNLKLELQSAGRLVKTGRGLMS